MKFQKPLSTDFGELPELLKEQFECLSIPGGNIVTNVFKDIHNSLLSVHYEILPTDAVLESFKKLGLKPSIFAEFCYDYRGQILYGDIENDQLIFEIYIIKEKDKFQCSFNMYLYTYDADNVIEDIKSYRGEESGLYSDAIYLAEWHQNILEEMFSALPPKATPSP